MTALPLHQRGALCRGGARPIPSPRQRRERQRKGVRPRSHDEECDAVLKEGVHHRCQEGSCRVSKETHNWRQRGAIML
jgi:hypothetical protein